MSDDREESVEDNTPSEDSDWDRRVLCSDGNCIGVIGPDGRCKECGKPYEGALPDRVTTEPDKPAASSPSAKTGENSGNKKEAGADKADDAFTEEASEDSDWDRRILCSDGNCIGVIGPNGRCTECGKPYEPNAVE